MTRVSQKWVDRVLTVLLNQPGGKFDHGEPGEVLYRLAEMAEVRYEETTRCVVHLEALGWVKVNRLYHDESARANKIVSVEVVA
jgi:hypothetical protein